MVATPEIIVMDRSWVLVGLVRPDPEDALSLVVDGCHVVRQWGTTEGLGQLAREGPRAETALYPEGDGVKVNKAYILRRIPCVASAWEATLTNSVSGATGSRTPEPTRGR